MPHATHDPTPQVKADPGMAVKMTVKSLATLDAALAGEPFDEDAVHELISFCDDRLDCADFRMLTILKLLYAAPKLSDELRAELKACVLGFKYWMDEPGDDGMCYWSENHQAIFAACEYLAGQLYPDETFTNIPVTGAERKLRAEVRLKRWLNHRFLYGFTEWHSNTYYEEDAAALVMIVDHAADEQLATRAAMILDLLMLDMAIHNFGGRFVGSSGRCYEAQKIDPKTADVNDMLAHAFNAKMDPLAPHKPDYERISSLFVLSEKYRTPEAIRQIANAEGHFVTRDSSGLALSEVDGEFTDPMDVESAGAFYWLMEAFTNVESIDVTVKAFEQWRMHRNRFLAPLAPFAKLAKLPGAKQTSLLRNLVRALNPATQGCAIQRANVYTYRTPAYHLSSAIHYHPGKFGDQQHIWQATLPGDITVFATHPGTPMFDNKARNFSPSYWVGNGRNPEVGQTENVLLALYDTRGRRGYLERKRQKFTHLYFPCPLFDETRVGTHYVAGRADDAYIGVRSLEPLSMASPEEFIQRGDVTGYAVICGDALDFTSLTDFVDLVKAAPLVYRRGRLTLFTPQGRAEVRFGKGAWWRGRKLDHEFARYDNPWVHAPRKPARLDICCNHHRLTLDWPSGKRQEGTC